MDEKVIIENIKKLRQSKNISVGQLGKLSGLTKGYISKIENSDKAPPLATLSRIAEALDTDVTFLLMETPETAENRNGMCVVRRNEGKTVISKGTLYGYNYMALAYKKAGKNMEPYIIEPALGDRETFSHEGEEFQHILEGTHEFYYHDVKYILEKGDSIYFDSIVPHGGRSVGKKRAKVLVVIFSYKR